MTILEGTSLTVCSSSATQYFRTTTILLARWCTIYSTWFSTSRDINVTVTTLHCHLFAESLTETDLILARAGLFSVTESQIEIMSVFPRHRRSLWRFWRPPRSCQYPDHKGKSTVVGRRHVIGLRLSRKIFSLFGENAAVESRKYKV